MASETYRAVSTGKEQQAAGSTFAVLIPQHGTSQCAWQSVFSTDPTLLCAIRKKDHSP